MTTYNAEWARRVLAETGTPPNQMIAAILALRAACNKALTSSQARDLAEAVLKGGDGSTSGAGADNLTALLEQARQRLALHPCAIEVNKEQDPPVASRLVDDALANVSRLREGGADVDAFPVPAQPAFIAEDGDEYYAQWEDASAEELRRVAAHAVVAAAIHRSAYEVQVMTALVALELAEVRDE